MCVARRLMKTYRCPFNGSLCNLCLTIADKPLKLLRISVGSVQSQMRTGEAGRNILVLSCDAQLNTRRQVQLDKPVRGVRFSHIRHTQLDKRWCRCLFGRTGELVAPMCKALIGNARLLAILWRGELRCDLLVDDRLPLLGCSTRFGVAHN